MLKQKLVVSRTIYTVKSVKAINALKIYGKMVESGYKFEVFTQISPDAIYFWRKVEDDLGSTCPAHIKNIV